MKQATLHRYFDSTYNPISTSRLSFLDLPYDIRHHVYDLAGLIRPCPIDLNSDSAVRDEDRLAFFDRSKRVDYNDVGAFKCFNRNKIFRAGGSRNNASFDAVDDFGVLCIPSPRACTCEPLPYRLLYVSRVISDEVSSILYAENKFIICRHNPRGLFPLQRLGPKALASIGDLCVGLNVCPCTGDHPAWAADRYCEACNSPPPGRSNKPLGSILRRERLIISEWSGLINRIATHSLRSHLELVLICDVADYETAEEVVKPLLMMPTLKDCSIRLAQRPDHQLRRLAETTIARLTGRSMEHLNSAFRFPNLPEEIQQQILGYTDLVAPCPLVWFPEPGLVSSSCCWHCMEGSESSCCPIIHAAFTAKCNCWRLPFEKFQVNRKMRGDAIRIFYSRNHFVIRAYRRHRAYCVMTPSQGSPSQSFPRFPRLAFRHLRSIQWVFPTFDVSSSPLSEDHLRDWSDTIELIAHTTDISRLSLTVDMASDIRDLHIAYSYGLVPNTSDSIMWAMYLRILEPMVLLKGLKDLFVHLGWPLGHGTRDLRDQQERELERRVMGEHYDSSSRGKLSTESLKDRSW